MADVLIYFFIASLLMLTQSESISGTASWTTYTSYAPCCKDNPNYNKSAPTEECDDYSACDYSGDFAALGHKSFSWVKSNNIVAFFDANDADAATNFDSKYGGKYITLTALGKTITAIIADTCGDDDCDGCCTTNANSQSGSDGYLVDMEYWTVINNFGKLGDADGTIEFTIDGSAYESDDDNDSTQDTWIYVVISIIIIITCSLGIGFFVYRSRKNKNTTDDQYRSGLMDEHNDQL